MRPHDLLRLKPDAFDSESLPLWAVRALNRAPFVVVRRANEDDGRVAVGIRGETRDQRFAVSVLASDVLAVFTPESIVRDAAWRTTRRSHLPIFRAIDRVAEAAQQSTLTWGPGGSAGFELVTGLPTTTESSDLDIVVRPASIHSRDALKKFRDALRDLEVRIDITLEARRESVALDEWLTSPRVLVKSPTGPRLGTFAW